MHFFLCIMSQCILIYERCKMWHHPPSNHPSTHPSILAQSHLTLRDPVDCSPPGSSVPGILQARTLERVAISSSRGSSRPGIQPVSLRVVQCRQILTTSATGSPHPLLWYIMCNIRYVWYVLYVIYVAQKCDVTPHIHPRWRHTPRPSPLPREPVASDASPAVAFVKGEGSGDWGPREPLGPGDGLPTQPVTAWVHVLIIHWAVRFWFVCFLYTCYTSIKTLIFKNMIFTESHWGKCTVEIILRSLSALRLLEFGFRQCFPQFPPNKDSMYPSDRQAARGPSISVSSGGWRA